MTDSAVASTRGSALATPRGLRLGSQRLPAHVAVMLGASVAGYGIALAVVTGLQSASEAAIAADRAPTSELLSGLAAGHDRLGGAVDRAAATATRALDRYQLLSSEISQLRADVDALSRLVSRVDGAAQALPASVKLPTVIRTPAAARPVVHATTGGSAAP
jgi:hypothetical protein